jgi:hypothetical protein
MKGGRKRNRSDAVSGDMDVTAQMQISTLRNKRHASLEEVIRALRTIAIDEGKLPVSSSSANADNANDDFFGEFIEDLRRQLEVDDADDVIHVEGPFDANGSSEGSQDVNNDAQELLVELDHIDTTTLGTPSLRRQLASDPNQGHRIPLLVQSLILEVADLQHEKMKMRSAAVSRRKDLLKTGLSSLLQ